MEVAAAAAAESGSGPASSRRPSRQSALANAQECLTDRPFTGWLRKCKGASAGRASRLLGDTNRRFFTVDFPKRMMFYAHSDRGKRISWPVPFQDLIRVSLASAASCDGDGEAEVEDAPSAVGRMNSRASMSSIYSRLSSGSIKSRRRDYGFVLVYRRSLEEHKMRLLCSSKAEAMQWVVALTSAMQLAAPDPNGAAAALEDISTNAGSGLSDAGSFDEDEANSGDLSSDEDD